YRQTSANRGRHPGRAPGRRRSPRRREGRGRPLHATLPVNHFATSEFWFHVRRLPPEPWKLADRCFAMLQADPRPPSLRLKTVGAFCLVGSCWSAHPCAGKGSPRGVGLVLDRSPRSLRGADRAVTDIEHLRRAQQGTAGDARRGVPCDSTHNVYPPRPPGTTFNSVSVPRSRTKRSPICTK